MRASQQTSHQSDPADSIRAGADYANLIVNYLPVEADENKLNVSASVFFFAVVACRNCLHPSVTSTQLSWFWTRKQVNPGIMDSCGSSTRAPRARRCPI